jgi:hypothetical protein
MVYLLLGYCSKCNYFVFYWVIVQNAIIKSSLATCWGTYCRDLVFEDSLFEIWRINVFFVHKNPKYMLESCFSCLENAKLCPKKENITLTLGGSASVQGCWVEP